MKKEVNQLMDEDKIVQFIEEIEPPKMDYKREVLKKILAAGWSRTAINNYLKYIGAST
jgi:hypothetical protein